MYIRKWTFVILVNLVHTEMDICNSCKPCNTEMDIYNLEVLHYIKKLGCGGIYSKDPLNQNYDKPCKPCSYENGRF